MQTDLAHGLDDAGRHRLGALGEGLLVQHHGAEQGPAHVVGAEGVAQ